MSEESWDFWVVVFFFEALFLKVRAEVTLPQTPLFAHWAQ